MLLSLDACRSAVECALPGFLQKNQVFASALDEAMAYSLLSPGKRLRPSFCLFGAQLFGAPQAFVLPFACAVEMIHAYSLIHDDLPCMDNDDLRRGRPTNHKVFGDAMALLAGDGLLSRAFEVMAEALRDCRSAENLRCAANAMAYITRMCGTTGMIAGQVADMTNLAAIDASVDKAALLSYIEQNKTGALICAGLVGGLLLANAPQEAVKAFEAYGKAFGMVFQITDDLLDELGDEQSFGKPLHSDVKNDKLTAVTLYGIQGAKQQAQYWIDQAHQALKPYPQALPLLDLIDALPQRIA